MVTSTLTSATDASFAATVRAEQAATLCRLSAVIVRGSALTGIFVGVILLQNNPLPWVGAWLGALLTSILFRDRLQALYLKEPRSREIDRWQWLILGGIAVYGFIWSLPGTLLMPPNPDDAVLMTLFMTGISAVAIPSLASMRHAFTCFIVPFLLPVALHYFSLGETFANAGIGMCTYIVAMVAVVHRHSHGVEATLRLQLENQALANRVQSEKAAIERINQDLERQIAQRERTEAELMSAKSEAEAASRAKSQFLANMSHELRTPLGAILGMSDLLIRSTQDAKQLKHLRIVKGGGERLLRIVSDILDLSRIEAGAMRFEQVPFSPPRLLSEVADFMGELGRRKGLAVTVGIEPGVPEQVGGDPYRVKQMLTNLVDNAIKFTETGAIEIRLRVSEALPHARASGARQVALRFSVRDSGLGISEADRQRLFRPFSQLDESTTRRFGGTGLGLAICRQFVLALGGTIDVTSTLGAGSTFWFDLPFESLDESKYVDFTETVARQIRLASRVLVVEDHQVNREMIAEVLEAHGCLVTTATNGLEALAKIEQHRFDLVFMDLHMPEMDGLTATRTLRAREQAKNRPEDRLGIIALTASVMPEDREACRQAGMDDFVAKPFTHRELMAALERWLPVAMGRKAG
jgi:signal transduction histidine kinase/CheY-like chemotaxis protein